MNKTIAQKRRELLDRVREELHEKRSEIERLKEAMAEVQDELDELHGLEDALIED